MKYEANSTMGTMLLNEVHFQIPPDSTAVIGPYTLQLDKIQRIEVIEKDKKRTTNSYVIGAFCYTLGAIALTAIIVAATKSSCPFVSAYTGNEFTLQGEIYGGAIYPQMVRHDYMPLIMQPLTDGSLQVKISNELHEHQYTDMADLWVITHDKNSKVLADEKGNLYNITDPQLPTNCLLNGKKDATAALQKAGDNYLMYMDDSTALNATNEAILKFTRPVAAKQGKLILSLKNSYFLDLLYGELAKGFGTYYTTYSEQQRKKPLEDQYLVAQTLTSWNRVWLQNMELLRKSSGFATLSAPQNPPRTGQNAQ